MSYARERDARANARPGGHPMRLFTAALALEANTFSPLATSYQAFLDKLYFPPGAHPAEPRHQTGACFAARELRATHGYTLIEGSCYAAQPGGSCNRAAYERMRDEILSELAAALPVEAIVLALHGAMVAVGYDDPEGDLLERMRALAPEAVIGVEYDLHCHLTEKRVRLADVSVLYKEYPHTDFVERGREVVDLVVRTVKGEIKPVSSLWDCRVLASFPTTVQPMRGFVDKMSGLEGHDRVLSISASHCFPYGDVPECGARMLVVTDDAKAHGDALARRLGDELAAIAETSAPASLSVDDAITKALALARGPVVIADTTDNAGGGAASDNTTFLHRLIARGVAGSAVAPIWDPIAVRLLHDAGVGAKLPFRFGGKTVAASGLPVDADVEVIACVKDAYQSFAGARVLVGDAAAIRTKEGVSAVLISTRAQAMGHDLFSNLGIDPREQRILVVKSNQHFHASYSEIAAEILYAEGDGPLPRDYRKLPWAKVRRPIWPLDGKTPGYRVV